jgi:hypothetical protein
MRRDADDFGNRDNALSRDAPPLPNRAVRYAQLSGDMGADSARPVENFLNVDHAAYLAALTDFGNNFF